MAGLPIGSNPLIFAQRYGALVGEVTAGDQFHGHVELAIRLAGVRNSLLFGSGIVVGVLVQGDVREARRARQAQEEEGAAVDAAAAAAGGLADERRHAELLVSYLGEERGCKEFRKQIGRAHV